MMTTANYMRPADPAPKPVTHTVAERMAKMREAKAAKAKARATTTGGAAPAAEDETPNAPVAQTTAQTKTILRELQAKFMPGSDAYELASKALRLLEARESGSMPGGGE